MNQMNQTEDISERFGNVPQPSPYLPEFLPPKKFDYDKDLFDQSTKSLVALGALAEISLSKLAVIDYIYSLSEAIKSSYIEGVHSTLNSVLQFETGQKMHHDDDEVVRCRNALNYGLQQLEKKTVSNSLILDMHAQLMKNQDPGQFRTRQNHLIADGYRPVYTPPPPIKIKGLMSNLEEYIQDYKQTPELVKIGVAHAQFEIIHPFADGNGRLGRILINLLLKEKKIILNSKFSMSAVFLKNRDEYYKQLLGVSKNASFSDWLNFFLKCINEAAEETKDKVTRAMNWHTKLLQEVASFSARSADGAKIIDYLFNISPVITTPKVRELIGKTYPTAINLVKHLTQTRILSDLTPSRKRRKIYCCSPLYDLFEH